MAFIAKTAAYPGRLLRAHTLAGTTHVLTSMHIFTHAHTYIHKSGLLLYTHPHRLHMCTYVHTCAYMCTRTIHACSHRSIFQICTDGLPCSYRQPPTCANAAWHSICPALPSRQLSGSRYLQCAPTVRQAEETGRSHQRSAPGRQKEQYWCTVNARPLPSPAVAQLPQPSGYSGQEPLSPGLPNSCSL